MDRRLLVICNEIVFNLDICIYVYFVKKNNLERFFFVLLFLIYFKCFLIIIIDFEKWLKNVWYGFKCLIRNMVVKCIYKWLGYVCLGVIKELLVIVSSVFK